MFHSRWRRATVAAVATLCASAAVATTANAAPTDLPDLVQGIPSAPNVDLEPGATQVNWGGFFDDHSISGDNHQGWSMSGPNGTSDHEPLMVRFQSTLTNNGNGAFEMCGYSSGNGWMRAYQETDDVLDDCPGTAPSSGANGWFRYAVANHSATGEFNRWHLMDLQRFALVPVSAPSGTRIQWDTRWGTCLNTNEYMDCEHGANATTLNTGIAAHTTKVTEEGAPDQTVVAFPDRVPNGTYQLVAISNPYGAIREAGTTYGSVSCVNLTVQGDEETGQWIVYQSTTQPANCQLPTSIPAALTGPGGQDPFAGENPASACNPLLTATGHCWAAIPGLADSPATAANPVARTNVTDRSTANATRSVAMYGAVGTQGGGTDPGDDDGNTNPGGGTNTGGGSTNTGGGGTVVTPPSQAPSGGGTTTIPPVTKITGQPKSLPALEARNARKYTRTAMRKMFGSLPSSAKVACKSTGGASASCTASWRRADGRKYSGTVKVWYSSDVKNVRWNYEASVKRTLHGKTTTTKRKAVVGGMVA